MLGFTNHLESKDILLIEPWASFKEPFMVAGVVIKWLLDSGHLKDTDYLSHCRLTARSLILNAETLPILVASPLLLPLATGIRSPDLGFAGVTMVLDQNVLGQNFELAVATCGKTQGRHFADQSNLGVEVRKTLPEFLFTCCTIQHDKSKQLTVNHRAE